MPSVHACTFSGRGVPNIQSLLWRLPLVSGVCCAPAVLATPAHVLGLSYLWTLKPGSAATLLLTAPVALLAVLMGLGQPALQYYGGSGAVLAVLLYFSMRHVKHVGLKVI
jgi:hypothetical protein